MTQRARDTGIHMRVSQAAGTLRVVGQKMAYSRLRGGIRRGRRPGDPRRHHHIGERAGARARYCRDWECVGGGRVSAGCGAVEQREATGCGGCRRRCTLCAT
jgi:hypothetical protein